MKEPFYGSRLKIERAVHHINNLLVEAGKIVDQNPYMIHIGKDVNGKGDLLKLDTSRTLPDYLLCILGDAFHNLRTSLDFAMTDIVFKPAKYTKFPVFDTVDALKAAVCGGLKENASREIIDFIVDVVQPYKEGHGHVIWALHALDIQDKHRLLITHLDYTNIRGICAVDERGEKFTIPEWSISHPQVSTYLCEGHHNIKILDHGKAEVRTMFGEGPMHGKFIRPVLDEMTEIVTDTIDRLRSVYLASVK